MPPPYTGAVMDPLLAAAMDGFDTGPVPNPEQARAIALLDAGECVLLTGPAGVGKTWVINHWLKKRGRDGVAVTASTGIAATHIGGSTVHSWSGCGIANKKASTIAGQWWWRDRVAPYIRDTDVLLIDEVSMLDGVTFELIGELCRRARKAPPGLPFGGLQVVLVGDMGQLAPVEEQERGFAFETDTWWDLGIQTVELTQVMRQRDASFIRVLQEVRDGTLSFEAYNVLAGRVRAFDPEARDAVRLMTHNAQVETVNTQKLRMLPGEERLFKAEDYGDEKALKRLNKNCLSPRELRLKVDARVMLTKNDPAGFYVNGSLGWVEGWEKRYGEESIKVRLDDGNTINVYVTEWKNTKTVFDKGQKRTYEKVEARRRQYPLRLAWSITIHKVQGMTLGCVSVDLTHVFAPGQAYVALSRARTLEGLNIEGWQGQDSVIAHPTVGAFVRGEYVLPAAEEAVETMHMSFGE